MKHRALITGITGQDGVYLARLLLEQGCEVHGIVRDGQGEHIDPTLRGRISVHFANLHSQQSLVRLYEVVQPERIYNLAAQSQVQRSWREPVADAEINAVAVARLLEAVRAVNPAIRFFQASTAEIFGRCRQEPQNEQTPICPHTPYGIAKAYAHWLCISYREKYGLFAANGILFNHESPLRSLDFVTRKVAHAAAGIKIGRGTKLRLGNLEARRDWGYAGDYVQAMALMLQHDRPDDYVIATGEAHTVRELVELAFEHVGLDWREHVEVDPGLVRVEDGAVRRGDSGKAKAQLGWTPAVSFKELVHLMVDADLETLGDRS